MKYSKSHQLFIRPQLLPPYVLLVILIISSCSDEKNEDPTTQNGFTLNGSFFEINYGYLDPFAKNVLNESYSMDLILSATKLNESATDPTFNFNYVILDINSTVEADIVNGTYEYSEMQKEFTFYGGSVGAVSTDGQIPQVWEITGGTITVKRDGSDYELVYTLKTTIGTYAEGYYRGSLLKLE